MTMTASQPSTLEGLLARGHELEDQGAIGAARHYYEQALTLFPASALPALNLGNAAFADGDVVLAEHWYRRALTIEPCAPAELNLGNLCLDRKQAEGALRHYQRALELRQSWPPAILGIANSLITLGQQADAEATLSNEVAKGLRDRSCLHLLADLQRRRNASAALATLALDPTPNAETWASRARSRTIQLDHRGALDDMLRALELDPHNDDYRRFAICSSMLVDDVTPEQLMSWARKPKQVEAGPLAPRPPLSGRRLRIAYLSCDFRRHAAAHYLYPIIRGHDPTRFEVWMLSGTPQLDDWSQRFRQLSAHWLDLRGHSKEDARNVIEALQLDVLVECSGATVDTMLPLLDIRLAPVQLSMIGFNLTTGCPTIDYRVVSELTDPVGSSEVWNVEKLLYVKSMEYVYHYFEGGHQVTDLPALSLGYLTVGYFNNSIKLNMETLRQLRRTLKNPLVRVVLVGIDHPETVSIIQASLEGYESRLKIFGRLPFSEYLAVIRSADIAWDSYPYSGSTTTLDCMLQGVPVLTLASNKSHARSTSARMRSVGFDAFVKSSDDERVEAVLAYAEDFTALKEIRLVLAQTTKSYLRTGQSVFSRNWDEQLLRLSEIHESDSSERSPNHNPEHPRD